MHSKSKAHKRCEFGMKVGVAVTSRSGFVASGLHFRAIRMMITRWQYSSFRLNGSPEISRKKYSWNVATAPAEWLNRRFLFRIRSVV